MKAGVTGATGFLGSNLVRLLLEQGHQVSVVRREKSNRVLLKGLDVEEHVGDIRDEDSLRGVFQGCDVVFHTAANVAVFGARRDRQSVRQAFDWYVANGMMHSRTA